MFQIESDVCAREYVQLNIFCYLIYKIMKKKKFTTAWHSFFCSFKHKGLKSLWQNCIITIKSCFVC